MCAAVISLSPSVALARPAICKDVFQRIDASAPAIAEGERLLELAPFLGEAAVKPLLARARTATTASEATTVYLAVGLSRHASSLAALAKEPRDDVAFVRLGQAIARLALGDATLSGTVAAALYEGPVTVRRRTAEALTYMEQTRPRVMLYDALHDDDPEVQLAAGRVHFPRRSRRARRVLLELLDDGAPEIKEAVAEVLVENRYRFSPATAGPLPDPLRGRALVDAAIRSSRGARTLRIQLLSRDPVERRAGFAGLAALGAVTPAYLERLAARPKTVFGSVVEGELTMALALMGDAASVQKLATLERDSAEAAAEVLFSFSGARAPYSQLDFEHAASLARALEGWVVRGVVSDATQGRLYRALYRAEPNAAAALARARLAGPFGRGLVAALRVLASTGRSADIPLLLAIADRHGAARVDAFSAAAAICTAAR